MVGRRGRSLRARRTTPGSLLATTVVVATALGGHSGASAEAEDPNDMPARCADDLTPIERASQVIVALVTDPTAAVEDLELRRISGIAPVGDVAPFLDTWLDLESSRFFDPPGLFASDEEGGVVQRFRDVFGAVPGARTQARELTPDEVRFGFEAYGEQLTEIGVTMAFAPVVDVGGGPAIGDRSYSDDPAVVIEYAGAVIDGYLRAGITPVLKHFPGHGRANADTHDGPATTPALDELRALDLVPFDSLIETHDDDIAVMVGHLVVPELTNGLPASLSRAAVAGLLRDEMGFDGLVVSDALGMGAIRQVASPVDAIVMFLRAGGDLALVDGADVDASRAAVFNAVQSGELEPLRLHVAVNRVLRVKGGQHDCARPWDLYAAGVLRGAIAPPE